ncbi:MAG TPA: molybdenum hydroxylase [Chloroflexi bacterium]|nr:molybdenum hydroxylase [Chloroflexota bacterium]HHW86978.1 EF2563 family selenium-dependent molybdenum hydroxylase system protein [Chloroflexota bacterium]
MRNDFPLVVIRGAGDLASGVALRLHRAGFPVIHTEIEHPLAVRRTVAFAQAAFDGVCRVEEVTGRRCGMADAAAVVAAGEVAVIIDPAGETLRRLHPPVVVDAIMAKRNTGTRCEDAPFVVALGPGFTAGVDCHAVIETERGHNLGRVIWQGSAAPDTGEPGELPGVGRRASRVLRAPAAGHVIGRCAIGDRVVAGAELAIVEDAAGEMYSIVAPFDGVLRGLIHPRVAVHPGMKIGDLDPRADVAACFTVSDKSLAIGGGALEAILMWLASSQTQ